MGKLPVRAVIFDLWGTLVYNIPHRTDFGEIAKVAEVPPETLWKTWRKFTSDSLRGVLKSGEERARRTLEMLGKPPEVIEKAAPLIAEFERQNRAGEVCFYPGVEDMLDELRSRGYKTGLISNCNYLTPEVVDRLKLREKLDALVLSVEVGLVKPELEIYRLTGERLDVPLKECFFVGDGGDSEMVGARQAGCITALVEQEYGHAYRYPDKEFITDYRLPVVTAVLDYLENAP